MSAKPKKREAVPQDVETVAETVASIPPCPPCDPAMSIKTPEVVAWWFKYFPVEAEAKYAGLTVPRP